MRTAIFTCTHEWNSPIQIGDHHLARGLAKRGWKVAFISTPISPLHVFSNGPLKRRFDNYKSEGAQDGNVWHYVPGSLVVPHHKVSVLNFPWLYHNWHRLTFPSLTQILSKNGYKNVDLLCIRDPKYHFLLDVVKYKRSVYRLADRDDGFDHYNSSFEKIEKKVCTTVDTVLYTAHVLRDYGKSRGARELRYFPHGVDWHRFANSNAPPPIEYTQINNPIAIYVGSIEGWFDYDSISNAAEKLPNMSFVIIGPYHRKNLFSGAPNIHLLGPKAYDDIPAYLRWADVGLIPFGMGIQYKKLVDGINPIKLYEYFAAGLPVISATWDEIERINSPALLYRTQEEFIYLLKSFERSNEHKDYLRLYAKNLDWGTRVTELESI
jgi:glycosyltransferase involved in cell wall biosynthesis